MLTPSISRQRFHFSAFAFVTAFSEAEAVSPMSLTGLDTVPHLPGGTATASLSPDGEAFSSDCPHRWKRFGDWDVCADCEERRQHEITRESDLVRLARPPAPFGNVATDRLAGEANVGLQAVARNSSPVMGNTDPGHGYMGRRRLPALGTLADSRQETAETQDGRDSRERPATSSPQDLT